MPICQYLKFLHVVIEKKGLCEIAALLARNRWALKYNANNRLNVTNYGHPESQLQAWAQWQEVFNVDHLIQRSIEQPHGTEQCDCWHTIWLATTDPQLPYSAIVGFWTPNEHLFCDGIQWWFLDFMRTFVGTDRTEKVGGPAVKPTKILLVGGNIQMATSRQV